MNFHFSIKVIILFVLFSFSRTVLCENYKPQWEPVPGEMLYKLIFSLEGKIVSTDSLSWPDGRSALFQYIKTKKEFYRCVDFRNESLQETGNMCYKLKKWPE